MHDSIPMGTACLNCRYDLGGLAWQVRCPECGYSAPATWPTGDLDEAHPAFIRTVRHQLRGLISADYTVLFGLACLAAAYLVTTLRYGQSRYSQLGGLLTIVGFLALAAGLLLGVLFAGYIAWPHRNARPKLDQPGRKAISMAFWWCVGPPVVGTLLTVVSGGLAACLLLLAIPISLVSASILFYGLFEHASSVIVRSKGDPNWTGLERSLGYGTLIPFMFAAMSLLFMPRAIPLLILAGIIMLVLTHLLRTHKAARCLRGAITLEDPSPEPPRS